MGNAAIDQRRPIHLGRCVDVWSLSLIVLLAATVNPAVAQVVPWFNGGGVSIGGGHMRLDEGIETPLIAMIRPQDDQIGAVDAGFALFLGTRRLSFMVPELRAISGWGEGELVDGSLTLGARSLTFEPQTRAFGAFAILFGAQVAVVPSGRVWVRGGIGGGEISSRIATKDSQVVIDLRDGAGLALSGGAGVSVWRKPVGTRGLMSVDAEVGYLRLRGDSLRISIPSVRVGWRLQRVGVPRNG